MDKRTTQVYVLLYKFCFENKSENLLSIQKHEILQNFGIFKSSFSSSINVAKLYYKHIMQTLLISPNSGAAGCG